MISNNVNIALLQMRVTESKRENLIKAARMASVAAADGANVIALPEMFCCPYDSKGFARYAEPANGSITDALRNIALKTGCIIVGGSMPESDEGHIYNTCFVFDAKGAIAARHRKLHLFDVSIDGGQRFRESETISRGASVTVFDTPFGKMGACICFDIRFPELFRSMALRGARVAFVPAAFNNTTGPLHWELLFRARAADNQLFAIGCAPATDTSAGYISYAHSIAVDPWGKVIAVAGRDECALHIHAELDLSDAVRKQLPILPAIRQGIY